MYPSECQKKCLVYVSVQFPVICCSEKLNIGKTDHGGSYNLFSQSYLAEIVNDGLVYHCIGRTHGNIVE